jgi:excinuclease ABC subunit C
LISQELKSLIENLGDAPGVYKFISSQHEVLYIGKAKDLRKRLQNYTQINKLSSRIVLMVKSAKSLEIINTKNENEALLLEHNLIKKFQPKFNILLKDSKTFPYIFINQHQFPQVLKHRGNKIESGKYFGPFAMASEVNDTIDLIRKIFKIRNCSDRDFAKRTKPCLEYQIKRCTAPCVKIVDAIEYQQQISGAINVLEGKSNAVQQQLQEQMLQYSEEQQYEKAGKVRDQLQLLTKIQIKQNNNIKNIKSADLITITYHQDLICILVNFYRDGNNFGAKPYFYPQESGILAKERLLANVLWQFIGQFYLENSPPLAIISNILPIDDEEEINQSSNSNNVDNIEDFILQISGKKTSFALGKIGFKLALVKESEQMAEIYLKQRIAENFKTQQNLLKLKEICQLSNIPQVIEVLDNSHISGTDQVGVLIATGESGFIKNRYRKFIVNDFTNAKQLPVIARNIALNAGNDLAILAEVLIRRFVQKENSIIKLPDFLLIDGGVLQLQTAEMVLKYLEVELPIASIAKGEKRNGGEETVYYFNSQQQIISYKLLKYDPFAYYLQNIRDEAHRFAVNFHKKRREKNITKSRLDDIAGIGNKRKQILLGHFGSINAIKQATIADLTTATGISTKLAKTILENLQ